MTSTGSRPGLTRPGSTGSDPVRIQSAGIVPRWIPQYQNTPTDAGLRDDPTGPDSPQGSVLTLEGQDLCHQNLRVQNLGESVHGRVHQLGAEDGQELFPDHLPLLRTRFWTWTSLPSAPGPCWAVSLGDPSEWVGPVPVLVGLDSAVLEVRRLAVGGPAERNQATAGVPGRAVVGRVGRNHPERAV